GEIKPGNAVKQHEAESDEPDDGCKRRPERVLKSLISFWAATQGGDLQQRHANRQRHEDAADLPQNKFQVTPAPQPPPGGDALAIPARMPGRVTRRVARSSAHSTPRDIRNDWTQ